MCIYIAHSKSIITDPLYHRKRDTWLQCLVAAVIVVWGVYYWNHLIPDECRLFQKLPNCITATIIPRVGYPLGLSRIDSHWRWHRALHWWPGALGGHKWRLLWDWKSIHMKKWNIRNQHSKLLSAQLNMGGKKKRVTPKPLFNISAHVGPMMHLCKI